MADDIAEVVTTDLVVRSRPEISHRSAIDPIRLNAGDVLFVFDGPVAADGYEWYRVVPFQPLSDTPPELPGSGWVAAGRVDDPWIVPWSGSCPEPTLERIVLQPAFINLACFGNRELTLVGMMTDCGGITGNQMTPIWLVSSFCFLAPSDSELELFSGLSVHREDGVVDLYAYLEKEVRVTGHFDDPAAQTCRDSSGLSGDAKEVRLACRTSFVATEIRDFAE